MTHHPRPLAIRATRSLSFLALAALAACTTTTGDASTGPTLPARPSLVADASTAPSAIPSMAAPSPTDSAAPEATVAATAVPTAIDPCTLITPAEASKLTGSSFGPSKPTTNANNARTCDYGQQGLFFNVLVVVAPDAATAKAQEPAFKADLEKMASDAGLKSVKLTELPDFEPGVDAAVIHGSVTAGGQTIKGVSLYALKGAVLFAMSEVMFGGTVTSDAAMEAQAKDSLGRLP